MATKDFKCLIGETIKSVKNTSINELVIKTVSGKKFVIDCDEQHCGVGILNIAEKIAISKAEAVPLDLGQLIDARELAWADDYTNTTCCIEDHEHDIDRIEEVDPDCDHNFVFSHSGRKSETYECTKCGKINYHRWYY